MEAARTPETETITSADVESTADSPAALTANLFFCSLCQSVYRQAKILPCLHSFCRPCLVGLVTHGPGGSHIHCPGCQYRAPLPSSGVVGVPDNSFLNRLCQDYVREIKGKMEEGQQPDPVPVSSTQSSLPTRTAARASSEGRTPSDRRGRDGPTGHDRETISKHGDDEEEEEEEEEIESMVPQDPFASERAAPSDSGDTEVTLEAIHNRNRLQAKVMGLQGEALRLTYAIDHINSWPEEWQQKREDLKRAVRAHSSQLQFVVKRAERALLAKIEEAGREADNRFMRAAEVGKQRLRDSLRNVLHEVNVLKGVRQLGMDAEVNTMCAFLLGRSVGMGEVALDMPAVALEGLGQKESDIHDMVTKSFGTMVFSEQRTDVFKPEPIDFSDIPVEDFVSKTTDADATKEVSGATSSDAGSPEENVGERRSRKRSTADKRRHMTDLGLDSPDVRQYLAQFQTARETFRARRKEILQQGQLGRVAAASPARGPESGEFGLDAVRARLRSSSREGGRIHSLDRGHPQIVPTGVSVSEIPSLMRRRGSAPVARSSSMSRLTAVGQTSGPTPAVASKYLSTGIVGKPPPSPVREEPGSPHDRALKTTGATSDADFYHSLMSPQVQRRHAPRERRHSLDAVPALENMSIPAAAELLTQAETSDSGSSRPIRRAISSAADKRAKIEILRETWHRRKEILIQNEGFVTLDSSGSPRQGSESTDSPGRGHSPPTSPKAVQDTGARGSDREKQPERKVSLTEIQPNTQQKGDQTDSTGQSSNTGSLDLKLVRSGISQSPSVSAAKSTTLYSSRGGPAAHLVNTVKISIPEVSERISPTPEAVKTMTKPAFAPAEEQNKRSASTEAMKPTETYTKANDEEATTKQAATLMKPTTPSGTDQQEEPAENVKTDTFIVTIPISASQTKATSTSTEATTTTTQESSPKPVTPAAPTYFFKSRLTGLPVGGSGASLTAPAAPPKPTHFFTSRITGLPVGGPVAPRMTSTSTASNTASVTQTTLVSRAAYKAEEIPKPTQIVTQAPTANTAVSRSVSQSQSVPTSTVSATDASVLTLQMSPVVTLPTTAVTIPAGVPSQTANLSTSDTSSAFSSRYTRNADVVNRNNRESSVLQRRVATADTTLPTEVYSGLTTSIGNAFMTVQNPAIATVPANASSLFSPRYTAGVSDPRSTGDSTTASNETTKNSTMPFFKSRLTGMPVGGSSMSSSTSASLSTTTAASTEPFFKSRLTGEPVGRAPSSITRMQNIRSDSALKSEDNTRTTSDSSSEATSTRYPSRYSVESRYKPRETVDVASLIAAMYKGNEKNITDTQAPVSSTEREGNTASDVTAHVVSSGTTTATAASTTTASDTEDKSKVRRELPPLRSAPAFSYARRYNLASSSSPSQQSTAASSESVLSGDAPKAPQFEPRSTLTQQYDTSSTVSKTFQTSSITPESSSERRYSQDIKTSKAYEQTPRTYSHESSRYNRGAPINPTGSRNEGDNFAEVQKFATQSFIDRGTMGRFNTTTSGDTTTALSQKLDYPRAHLPDVIPETTLKLTSSEETLITAPGGTIEDVRDMTSTDPKSNVSNVKARTEIHDTASVEMAKTSQEVKKSFGFDVDSEISRGISITDAIRRSSSPLLPRHSPALSRRSGVPEPLDLQVGAVAGSPTGVLETKEASSPNTKSPLPSPSSPNPAERGIKGRLKEIARKKKERWRHLTIH